MMKLPDSRILFALLILLLCTAGVLLHGLPALPAELYAGPTPAPVPTPTPEPVPTPIPGAVTVLADGKPILTLETREQAQALLQARLTLAASAIPENEALVSASFASEMTLREAQSGEEPLTPEQAQAALNDNPSLCPVRCVTRTAVAESLAFSTEQGKDARIPKGARLIGMGRAGERVSITKNTYLNGAPEGCPVVTQQDTAAPLAQRTVEGTYAPSRPDREPGRSEGEKGPAAPEGFSLSLPCKGSILSNFGMRWGSMHYGIDIECKVGDGLYAPAAGSVVFAGPRGSYGFVLEIDHGEGFVTRIAPVAQCTLTIGDAVAAGDPIGVLAAPEDEEAKPHLHMELLIRHIPYNPRQYLK